MSRSHWTSPSLAPHSPPPQSPLVSSIHHHHHHQQQALPAQRALQQAYNSPQSHTYTHSIQPYNAVPSGEQRTAVDLLQEIPIPTILACLDCSRSWRRGTWPIHLSDQQQQAVFTLSRYPNDVVQTWLNTARSSGTLNASQDVHSNDYFSNGGVVPDDYAWPPSHSSENPTPARPRNRLDQESYNLSRNAPVPSQTFPAAASNNYKSWCTICEPRVEFTTSDSYKRHMRVHNKKYFCIPREPLVPTERGSTCAFCSETNPDPRHLDQHKAPTCGGKTFTRRGALTNHLEDKHGAHNGSVLAEYFECTVSQRYFGCGFCGLCCESLNDQLNHVDACHWKLSEHIDDWDNSKLIRGILSQPEVHKFWRAQLAAYPHLQESQFTWKPTEAKNLRRRLEMSQEPAVFLCQAAFDQSNFGISQHNHAQLVPATGPTNIQIDMAGTIETPQSDYVLSRWPYTPDQGYPTLAPWMTAPTLQSIRLAPDWVEIDSMGQYAISDDQQSSQMSPEAHSLPHTAMHHYADRRAQPSFSPDSDQSLMRRRHQAFVPSNASASYAPEELQSQASAWYDSRSYEHPPGVSHDGATHPTSRQEVETYSHPAPAHAGRFQSSLAYQSASSPLSRSRETPSQGHLNGAYPETPDTHSYFVPSNQQRSMQDRNHGRRQRFAFNPRSGDGDSS